jgi:hypothetical protein
MSNQLGHYGGLGRVWSGRTLGDKDLKSSNYVIASHLIPKKTPDLSADQATYYLRNFSIAQGYTNPKLQAVGNIYWMKSGPPHFSKKPVLGGKMASEVLPPKIKKILRTHVVRDLPKLDLAPIEVPAPKDTKGKVHGLDGISFSSPLTWLVVLGVLGLIFVGVRRYNKVA